MEKDLTNSKLDRQNILNNEYAIEEIKKAFQIKGVMFENRFRFIKEQVAKFYEVDVRTIERYLEQYNDELIENGYEIIKGKRLKEFMKKYNMEVADINAGDIPKTIPALSIFDFRTLLNMGMLLIESERARLVRKMVLDIVIDTINVKTGGETKYINQRDEDFINSWYEEENYRREFTDALKNYVVGGKFLFRIQVLDEYLSRKEKESIKY